jgi:Spy/CpxP family protein refolding chaperone
VNKVALVVVLLLLAPMGFVAEAQIPQRGERARMEAAQERRAHLERQVRERFLGHATERLQLNDQQRDRLRAVLERGAEERLQLARDSRGLRAEMMRAVRDDATPRATYERLLTQLEELREREIALERRESAALGRFLEPRQQAAFLVLRIQLNEQVRDMRGTPPGERRRSPGGSSGT